MRPDLRKFEGLKVEGAALRVTGKIAERIGELAKGEVVYFVGVGPVTEVAFKEVDDALVRFHVIKATSVVLIERKDGERMLTEGSMLADERFGVQNLFSGGDGESPD